MGKGGSGSASVPKVKIPSGLKNLDNTVFPSLGYYASSLFGPIQSMANWASDIATGGNAVQSNAFVGQGNSASNFGQYAGAGPAQTYGGMGGVGNWQDLGRQLGLSQADISQFQSMGMTPDQVAKRFGLGGQSVPGQGGAPGVMSAGSPGGANAGMTSLSPAQIQQLTQAGYQGVVQNGKFQGLTPGMMVSPGQQLAGSGSKAPTSLSDFFGSGFGAQSGGQSFMPGGQVSGGTGGDFSSLLGPFLSNAWNMIGQEQQATQMLPGMIANTNALGQQAMSDSSKFMGQGDTLMGSAQGILGQGGNMLSQGEQMLTDATTGAGLYPSQQAMVNQAVATQKTNLANQLASEGLGSSTMLQQLSGQADLSGAATAGQLIQSNIAAAQAQQQLGLGEQGVGLSQEQIAQNQYNLGQASQKLALGAQELSLGEQGALTQELATISSQSSGLQGQMWTQAMQGYGTLGNIIQTALSGFGYAMQGFNIETGVSAQNASNALQAQLASQQANNQGMSSMMGGLGQLLGSGSGGSGGLLGGLGSLFGGIGGTVGAGAGALGGIGALAGAGAASGGTAAGLAAVGTAAGLAFCEVPIQAGHGGGWVAMLLTAIAMLLERLNRKRV